MSRSDNAAAATQPSSAHRIDIDGLRGIAVLAVLLAHTGHEVFEGGFIGVDVFFVISGYLITQILWRDITAGTLSLRRFYMRRVRRILPALTVVVALSFPFAWWLMMPDFRQNFGQSAVATMASANNLLLSVTSGYWELESEFKPLLHTWSLGVEEQFYIVFPLLLAGVAWLLRKRKAAVVAVLSIAAAASLLAAQAGVSADAAAAFYLPHYRAWELLVGALVALVPLPRFRGDAALPAVGIGAIVASVLWFTAATPSPSAWLLLPTLGTALVLAYPGQDSIAHKVLAWQPLVALGLMSYSAYLIHQPVFAFVRVASLEEPSPWLFTALLVPVIGLSALSLRWVETPFRNPAKVSTPKVFAALVPSSALIVAAGLALHIYQGFPEQAFPNMDDAGDVYISYNERVREYTVSDGTVESAACVLVIGNSFGRDAANVLLEGSPSIKSCIAYLEPGSSLLTPQELELLRPAIDRNTLVVYAVQNQSPTEVLANLDALSSLGASDVTVFGTKNFGWNLNPFARVPLEQRGEARATVLPEVADLNNALAAQVPGYVDIIRVLGEDGRTVAVFDAQGNPLSPDRVHLTRYGAQLLAERLGVEEWL